jgi:hypothetical protein
MQCVIKHRYTVKTLKISMIQQSLLMEFKTERIRQMILRSFTSKASDQLFTLKPHTPLFLHWSIIRVLHKLTLKYHLNFFKAPDIFHSFTLEYHTNFSNIHAELSDQLFIHCIRTETSYHIHTEASNLLSILSFWSLHSYKGIRTISYSVTRQFHP